MTAVCPSGHTSTAADYCDVCGLPISGPAGAEPGTGMAPPSTLPPTPVPMPVEAPSPPVGVRCPNCDAANVPDALFCEACGYDFVTQAKPRDATPQPESPPQPDPDPQPGPAADDAQPAATTWVAELWIDPAWYAAQESPDSLPTPGPPTIVPLRGRSLLVGRTSRSRNIHPDVDCAIDTGASRRQAQLTTDGTRWWVEDLESANGTFVARATDPVPDDPIPVGSKHELSPGDRIYVGAWTRLVIRMATEDELATLG